LHNALRLPKQLVTGLDSPGEPVTVLAAAVLVLLILAFVFRTPAPERRLAIFAATTGATAIIGGVLLSVLGVGFLSPRYFVGALIPCLVVLASGIAVCRRALMAGALLCLLGLGISVAVASDPTYQRVDYRSAAKAVGAPTRERAIVVTPGTAFQIYLPETTDFTGPSPVQEIVAIGLAYEDAGVHDPPRPRTVPVPAGFRLVERRLGRRYTLLRFRSDRPREVSATDLDRARLAEGQDETTLIQRPR
jgi:hypothetical protein